MPTKDWIDRMLAYDRWANEKTLASVAAMAKPPAKALELLGHLLGAQVSWIERMTRGRDPADWERWETMDVPALERASRDEAPAAWTAFLADAALSDPARTFSYVNYLGQSWTARVGDVLVQLSLHGAYHRGQIASFVRAGGGEPAVTDYLRAVRAGAL